MKTNNNKKYKRPKQKTSMTTNPQASKNTSDSNENEKHSLQPRCPLLAKDSEWIDTLQTSTADSSRTIQNVSDEEEALQLVECEDLTIMFPGLLKEDIEDMLNKTMSTTEVTKHLLGQKANFSLMKKVRRLIPNDKKWLETLPEDVYSASSETQSGCEISNVATHSNECKKSAENHNFKKSTINQSTSKTHKHASTSSSKNIVHK